MKPDPTTLVMTVHLLWGRIVFSHGVWQDSSVDVCCEDKVFIYFILAGVFHPSVCKIGIKFGRLKPFFSLSTEMVLNLTILALFLVS